MTNEKKPFNPAELLKEVLHESQNTAKQLQEISLQFELEKQRLKEERETFLERFDDRLNEFKQLKFQTECSMNALNQQTKLNMGLFDEKADQINQSIEKFREIKHLYTYAIVFVLFLVVISLVSAVFFYKTSILSKQEIISEYRRNLSKKGEVIVSNEKKQELISIQEWMEKNPKTSQSIQKHINKRKNEVDKK